MDKTITTPYDIAQHLRNSEEMAAYLEACLEEAGNDSAFIAKALMDIARAQIMTKIDHAQGMISNEYYQFDFLFQDDGVQRQNFAFPKGGENQICRGLS